MMNENKDRTYQNLQDAVKAEVRGKFRNVNPYNLTLLLNELEKEEQTKPKDPRRMEIIWTRAEIMKERIEKQERKSTKAKVRFQK